MAGMFGMGKARLAYVVVPLEGTVKRHRYTVTPKKSQHKVDRHGNKIVMFERTRELVEEPAGFMVYFPRGHAVRIKDKRGLERYHLDGPPQPINADDLLGTLIRADSDEGRRLAMMSLEKQVIALATKKSGPQLLGSVIEKEAA